MTQAAWDKRYIYMWINGRAVRQHVAIAERVLGRRLPRGACVHHVNGDGRDNMPSNLVICQDGSYHRLLHVRQRVRSLGGNPNTERVCYSCLAPRPLTEFRMNTLYKGARYRRTICRDCTNTYKRQRRRIAGS
jgi:HNH endonuclease